MLPDKRPLGPPRLARTLGPVTVLLLTLSAATPASSLFAIVPGMLQVAGSGALVAMLLGASVCVGTAYIYAELSSAWPIAGGEYVMVARTLGPMAGFVILGVNLFNNMLFPPVVALGIADVLGTVIPAVPRLPVALGVMLLATLVGILNIRVNAWLTGAFLLVELAALAVLAALGFAHPAQSLATLLAHPAIASGAATPAQIGVATTIAIFAFNGYGMAVYFGEDMREAHTKIARVILLAFAVTFVAEVGPLAAVLSGARDLPALYAAADPFGAFTLDRGGKTLAGWMAVGVALAMANAGIVTILACARFLFSTGRDRVWGRPIDRLLGAIDGRFGSPWAGTLLIGVVGMACCFLPLPLLLVLSGGGVIATYAAIALAAIVGRYTGATAQAPYRMPWFPLAPALTLIALAGVIAVNWMDAAQGRPGLIATAVQMLAAALYYAFVLCGGGRSWIVTEP
jgi:amino acid transporter